MSKYEHFGPPEAPGPFGVVFGPAQPGPDRRVARAAPRGTPAQRRHRARSTSTMMIVLKQKFVSTTKTMKSMTTNTTTMTMNLKNESASTAATTKSITTRRAREDDIDDRTPKNNSCHQRRRCKSITATTITATSRSKAQRQKPNRHRSRSENENTRSNLWTPESENSNPTSGHLKVKMLNKLLDA